MNGTWYTNATYRSEEDKTVLDIAESFFGQQRPIFAPKTVFLADFEIIGGISTFFFVLNG